ncbi:hypothetical protein GCM10009564_36630 [Streptomyces thermogriseus]|uniref:Uncharacterized protein n=1 Tax=Streptomyces thermogriseus TaxID=75292 RepID=A0ABN1T264_9ACTN
MPVGAGAGAGTGTGRHPCGAVRARAGNASGKRCESTVRGVLIFWMSEGTGPHKGRKPEDTPNARVAE